MFLEELEGFEQTVECLRGIAFRPIAAGNGVVVAGQRAIRLPHVCEAASLRETEGCVGCGHVEGRVLWRGALRAVFGIVIEGEAVLRIAKGLLDLVAHHFANHEELLKNGHAESEHTSNRAIEWKGCSMGYLDTINRVMSGSFESATDAEREAATKEVITVCAVAASAVTIQPFPVADVVLMSPIQIAMVQAIGKVHGHRLEKKSILEILSTFGASLIAQNVIIAAAKIVPFFGSIVAMSMAYALTFAIGEVSDMYFRKGSSVSADELKEKFQEIYKEKKAEKEREAKGNKTLKTKLDNLKKAYESGVLTEEEFTKKKEEVLAGF